MRLMLTAMALYALLCNQFCVHHAASVLQWLGPLSYFLTYIEDHWITDLSIPLDLIVFFKKPMCIYVYIILYMLAINSRKMNTNIRIRVNTRIVQILANTRRIFAK